MGLAAVELPIVWPPRGDLVSRHAEGEASKAPPPSGLGTGCLGTGDLTRLIVPAYPKSARPWRPTRGREATPFEAE